MGQKETLIGKKYNKLTVLEYSYTKNGRRFWKCKCDCGNITIAPTYKLKNGSKKSCGCLLLKKGESNLKAIKHNKSKTRLYHILDNMKARCYNVNNKRYKNYGGRGIRICEEWLDKDNGFLNFYAWAMDNGYKEDLTIDRKDVNGNYEPDNCRWRSWKEQANNKTNNFYIEYHEEKHTLQEWSRILPINISWSLLRYRILKGWEIEKAFTYPVRRRHNEKTRN